MLLNEKLPSQVWEFSAENCPNGSLAIVAKFHTNPYNVVACLPSPYKLSILGDIWRAIILPFSSSKCLYSSLRLSNLVYLSFEYHSFSNKRKTTILFPSPLTFFAKGYWVSENLNQNSYLPTRLLSKSQTVVKPTAGPKYSGSSLNGHFTKPRLNSRKNSVFTHSRERPRRLWGLWDFERRCPTVPQGYTARA